MKRPPILDNPRSDRIRSVAALGGRSARKRAGRILIEGPQSVAELLLHRANFVVDVYFSEDAAERDPELLAVARSAVRWVHLTTEDVANALSRDAQGVVAVAERAAITGGSAEKFAKSFGGSGQSPAAAPLHTPAGDTTQRGVFAPFAIYLPQTQDPGNAGTIIRSADALGASAVFVGPGTVEVGNPKVIRASAGSVFHLPIISAGFADLKPLLQPEGWLFLGTSGSNSDLDLNALITACVRGTPQPTPSQGHQNGTAHHLRDRGILEAPHIWVFGNESRGLSKTEMDSCDHLVRIPIPGDAESLNAAAAAAICLHASSLLRF